MHTNADHKGSLVPSLAGSLLATKLHFAMPEKSSLHRNYLKELKKKKKSQAVPFHLSTNQDVANPSRSWFSQQTPMPASSSGHCPNNGMHGVLLLCQGSHAWGNGAVLCAGVS